MTAPVTPVPTILTIGAHNVYYVKYGGFVLKFMCSALSVA